MARIPEVRRLILAGRLGRAARGRFEAGEGEQPRPEMYDWGSKELDRWKKSYQGEGRQSSWGQRKVFAGNAGGQGPSQALLPDEVAVPSVTDQDGFTLQRMPSQTKKTEPAPKPPKPRNQMAESMQRAAANRKPTTGTRSKMGSTIASATAVDVSILSDAHRAAAKDWPDAERCLEWAAEQLQTLGEIATVKEMTAWRNLQGE